MFPELLVGRHDGVAPGRWSIREGSTTRGSASCQVGERVLEVPLAADESSRVVRAHELMHARVSPLAHHLVRHLDEVSPRALECAEEMRVNVLLGRLGFDVALLCDGTEKIGARRLAETGAWGEAVCFLAAVIGTGAEKPFLAGIRQGRADWLTGLRAVRKRALAVFDAWDSAALADTRCEDDVPSGYARSTLVLARLLTRASAARSPRNAEELRVFRRSLESGARRAPTGVFAALVVDEAVAGPSARRSSPVRRSRAATSGTTMRYPGRLVSDAGRRAFERRVRGTGGVVVVDQSGSMEMTGEDVAALVRDAPGALVVGYSHRPGDLGQTANAWLLSCRGRAAAPGRSGNVGNGVDGPVLRWALARRRSREPFVWITDGQVTDSHDHPDEGLSRECAELVVRHRIRLARDLEEARRALRHGGATPRGDFARFGRVGRALRGNT